MHHRQKEIKRLASYLNHPHFSALHAFDVSPASQDEKEREAREIVRTRHTAIQRECHFPIQASSFSFTFAFPQVPAGNLIIIHGPSPYTAIRHQHCAYLQQRTHIMPRKMQPTFPVSRCSWLWISKWTGQCIAKSSLVAYAWRQNTKMTQTSQYLPHGLMLAVIASSWLPLLFCGTWSASIRKNLGGFPRFFFLSYFSNRVQDDDTSHTMSRSSECEMFVDHFPLYLSCY